MHLITGLQMVAIIRMVVWTALGFAVYLGYGLRHSKLNTARRARTGAHRVV